MSVLLLAGVHGVGKGFLGKSIANSIEIVHLTASHLIRYEKGQITWGNDKKTSNLNENQLALIQAVRRRRLAYPNILLDGHFVLRDSQGILVPLATTVFRDLNLNGVILLTEDDDVIARRLESRDKVTPNIQAIAELTAAESTHAELVCNELNLPLTKIHAPTLASLTNAVERFLTE
jgi:adenylate kinase